PISLRMNSAVAVSSSIGLVLALPNGSSDLSLNVTAVTDLGAVVSIAFESETLGAFQNAPHFLVTGEERVQAIPLAVLGDVQNLISLPGAMYAGALHFPFYPWGDPFDQHISYSEEVAGQLAWLVGPTPTASPPAISGELCLADAPTLVSGNFTVNALGTVSCQFGAA